MNAGSLVDVPCGGGNTLKNDLMQKNLFDFFALTDSGYTKSLGAQVQLLPLILNLY